MVGTKIGDDLRHPMVGDCGVQRVAAVDPCRVGGGSLAARDASRRVLCYGEGPRCISTKGWQVSNDAELSVPGENQPLQRPLPFHERAGQRAADAVAVRVLAARPGEPRRAVRPVAHGGVRHAKVFGQHLVLDLFLPRRRNDRVVPREGHPVDELLPLRPVVPHQRVAVRAHLSDVGIRHGARAGHRRVADLGPGLRGEQAAPAASRPADRHSAVLAQVDAEPAREL